MTERHQLRSPLRRGLCITLLAALPTVVSCQTSRAGQGGTVDPSEVPTEMLDEYQALVDAQAGDKSSEAVEAAANALIEQEPPPELQAEALAAKAERQYLLGEDDEAIAEADRALALLGPESGRPSKRRVRLLAALNRTVALASVRGGDPSRALRLLDQIQQAGEMDRVELRGARAVALDRKGDTAASLAAFVAWRELLADDAPEAGYAEERIAGLVGHLDRATIEGLAASAPGPDAGDCLRAMLGSDPGEQAPTWVRDCRRLPARIGILLPRSGKLSALAEAQLAAAVAAVTVLGATRPVSVMWRDSGSTPETARAGAERLLADGAEIIIGPVGASNVKSAIAAAGGERFLLPGEASGQTRGIAPTLEQRALALVAFARSQGATEIIVMTPDSGYGRRVKAIENQVERNGLKSLKFIDYSSSTTTFAPILAPHVDALRGGAVLIIADALSRTELIVRQLRRESLRVRGGAVDKEGVEVTVMGTGEGLAAEAIGAKHASLDGVILAPVAFPDAASRAFEDAFFAQQQRRPDDQALLVWRALDAAWGGAAATLDPKPTLVRVQGSGFVAISTP